MVHRRRSTEEQTTQGYGAVDTQVGSNNLVDLHLSSCAPRSVITEGDTDYVVAALAFWVVGFGRLLHRQQFAALLDGAVAVPRFMERSWGVQATGEVYRGNIWNVYEQKERNVYDYNRKNES
jgi:hypothetical protein